MAVVLVLRPWGLLGRPLAEARVLPAEQGGLFVPPRALLVGVIAVLALVPLLADAYTLVLLTEVFVFALFAVSLHFLLGPGGMVSFGHAAYFGLGAYAAALLLRYPLPMEWALLAAPLAALTGAAVFGWLCVRLSGIYLAMLTLALAQIVWSVAFNGTRSPAARTGWSEYGLRRGLRRGRLLLRRARIQRRLDCLPLAHPCLAVRQRSARQPRLAGARRSHRHRCARPALDRVHDRRHSRRACRRPVRLLQGLDLARNAVGAALSGRTGDGPAWRRSDADRAVWGAALFTWLEDALAREIAYWRAPSGR